MIVAYDGSEPARRALEHAARIARRGSVVDVVNVIPVQSVSSRLVTVTDEQDRAQKRLLREASAILRGSGVRAHLISAAGDPATGRGQRACAGGNGRARTRIDLRGLPASSSSTSSTQA